MIEANVKEKCAVFGVYGKENASYLVNLGLGALQHRGQEGSGIVTSDEKKLFSYKKRGLVFDIFTEDILWNLNGSIAIGHNRYSTSGGTFVDHTQPVIDPDRIFALAHNGNLPSTAILENFLDKHEVNRENMNDSEMMYLAIKRYLLKGYAIEEAIEKCLPLFTGAYSLLIMTKDKLIAIRDRCGIRPLSIGSLGNAFIVSSETCGFDIIGAKYIRDVEPGEMVVIGRHGLKSYQMYKGRLNLDVFEMIYFARPDSLLLGNVVNEVRRNLGKQLARENNIVADLVIPVPDSAIPMALGYAEESGVAFDFALIKNRYIHRTFIEPVHTRIQKVRLKYNVLPEVIKGKKIIVIDDSIVRGSTSSQLVQMLKSQGASRVYLLSASPPVLYPDFYGIDTPDQKDLVASQMSIPKIQEFIRADYLNYLSYRGMIEATGVKESSLCTSCFTGKYPIDIGERVKEFVYLNRMR